MLAGVVAWNVSVIIRGSSSPSEEILSTGGIMPERTETVAAAKETEEPTLPEPLDVEARQYIGLETQLDDSEATHPPADKVDSPIRPGGVLTATDEETPPSIMVPGATVGTGHALSHTVTSGTIEPGQPIGAALMEADLTGDQAHRVVAALNAVFDVRRSRPGEGFRIKRTVDGELRLFEYERSPIRSFLVRERNGELVGEEREVEPELEIVLKKGEIRSSLFGAVTSAGADISLAVLLANVLAWDVDFYRDPRRGDEFRVVVERFHHRGRHLGYGDILAAEYKGEVGHVRLFHYERDDGEAGYYDEEGQSAQRAFLRAPLQVARITSGYGNRRHPILGYSRKHRGVDYGAPTGTPVWAVGDGTVITAGRRGNYGNLVVIRHANAYTTWYAHLSRIHVRVGERVRQQQVIGRVGATGMATGPHLHYEIRHRGRHINPLTLRLPPRDPLPDSVIPKFHEAIAEVRAMLDNGRS